MPLAVQYGKRADKTRLTFDYHCGIRWSDELAVLQELPVEPGRPGGYAGVPLIPSRRASQGGAPERYDAIGR